MLNDVFEAVREFFDTPIMGSAVTFGIVLVYFLLVILGIVIASRVPPWIAEVIVRLIARTRSYSDPAGGELSERTKNAIRRYLEVIILACTFLLSIFVLGIDLSTKINLGGADPTMLDMILFFISLLVIFLFIKMVLSPLTGIILHFSLGGKVGRLEEREMHRRLLRPLNMIFVLLGFAVAVSIAFEEIPYKEWVLPLFMFFGTLIIGYLIATLAQIFVRITYFKDTPTGYLQFSPVEKLAMYFVLIIAFGVALVNLGIDLVAVATGLGLIGFALAFGMQDTIANLMAGVMIAIDKPFKIGDRIMVGEKWGDVVDITLRSTRIVTTEEEMVIIPNNIIATQEVWNYTKIKKRVAVIVDIGVSYDTDIRMAEKILLAVAGDHPYVLARPAPYMWVDEFADSGINLKLWAWIEDARDKFQIRSDILRAVKVKFDEDGIDIPYPHRTVVYRKDMNDPAQFSEGDEYDEIRFYNTMGEVRIKHTAGERDGSAALPSKVEIRPLKKYLLPIGALPFIRSNMDALFSMMKRLDGSLVVMYVVNTRRSGDQEKARRVLEEFNTIGEEVGVDVQTRIREGDFSLQSLAIIKEERLDGVVVSHAHRVISKKVLGIDYLELISSEVGVPVFVLPHKHTKGPAHRDHHESWKRKGNAPKKAGAKRARPGKGASKDDGRSAKGK